jgi:cytochrome c oxidase subunit 2
MGEEEPLAGSEELTTSRESRRQLRQMLAIGAVTSALGIALGLIIDWFPVQASGEARPIDTLWDVLIIASVPVFVLVQTIVLYSVWKFRMKPGEEAKDGPPIHGNTRLEIVWTVIPALLLVCLCSYAYVVLRDIEDAQANTMEVRVVGEQFTWTFYYPDGEGREIVSNQLYLPVDRPVKFNVQSKDVIHDFWVPAFRLKIDAVPGITTNIRVTPERIGRYPLLCAELCGLGHSVMRQTAHVVSGKDYRAWFAEKRERGQAGDGGQGGAGAGGTDSGGGATASVDGKTLFNEAEPSCASCHTLGDAGANGQVGPNLDESLQGKDEAYIRRAIVEPGADVAEGYSPGIMPPNYGQTLDPQEVDALVDYLAEVTR